MVEALASIRQGNQAGLRKFLLLTILGGACFLGLQAFEWTHLFEHGQSITKNNFGATFFILTGFHGMHVFSGVVYLTCILVAALPVPRVEQQLGRDRRAVLALRRSHLDPRVHVRLSDLGAL